MHRVLVIGATGRVGRQVVSQLPADAKIRAMVRSRRAAEFPPHVEVVAGDLNLPKTLDQCLDGVDAVFLVWTAPPASVPAALNRIVGQVPRIVFLSSPYKTAHPFFQAGQPNPITSLHTQIERLIEASGRQWTFLRPGIFASNSLTWWAPQVRAGNDVVRWPYAAAPTAPIDERDIAVVAVRALCEAGHAGAEYLLTGPESLTQSEQLEIIGAAIGRPLRMEEIPPEEARRELNLAPFVVNMLLGAWVGAIGQPAFITSTVRDITGASARTFRDWATDHAAEWRSPPTSAK
jgi:uncharacterized protein YbjT (DUF2867 family)